MSTNQHLIDLISIINAKGKDDLIEWSIFNESNFNFKDFEDYKYIELQNQLTKAETSFLIKYINEQSSVTDYCKIKGDTIFIGVGSQIFTLKIWDYSGGLDFEMQATLLLNAFLASNRLKLKVDDNHICLLTTVGKEILHIRIKRGESFKTYASFMDRYTGIESIEQIADNHHVHVFAKNICYSGSGLTELIMDPVGVPSIKHMGYYTGKEPIAFNIPDFLVTKGTHTVSIKLLAKFSNSHNAHMICANLPRMQVYKLQLNREVSAQLAKIHESLILL